MQFAYAWTMSPPKAPNATAKRRGMAAPARAPELASGVILAANIRRDIAVVGAPAGGLEALQVLLDALPADLQAAVLVVLHTGPEATGHMAEILSRAGPLPAVYPLDGAAVTHGCVMVAPPDHHLVVDG